LVWDIALTCSPHDWDKEAVVDAGPPPPAVDEGPPPVFIPPSAAAVETTMAPSPTLGEETIKEEVM